MLQGGRSCYQPVKLAWLKIVTFNATAILRRKSIPCLVFWHYCPDSQLTYIAAPAGQLPTVNNMSQNTQSRAATSGRVIASKPSMTASLRCCSRADRWTGTWGQAGFPAPAQQARDAVAPDSWAQAMGGSRATNAQLDLSASSFPSLNNTGLQSQNHAVGSSAWQTGPPQNEQAQRQQMQPSRSHLTSRQQQPTGVRDSFYPTDTYSRNAPMEFPSETTSQPIRRASQAPGGPPGLTQRQPNQGDSTPQDPSRVTSPSGQTQICTWSYRHGFTNY